MRPRMRTLVLIASLLLMSGFALAFSPAASARPSPVCTEQGGHCPGVVCVDSNLDGQFDSKDTCVIILCPEYGCCYDSCPPPYY